MLKIVLSSIYIEFLICLTWGNYGFRFYKVKRIFEIGLQAKGGGAFYERKSGRVV